MQPPLRRRRGIHNIQSTVNDIFDLIERTRRARLANMINPVTEGGLSPTVDSTAEQTERPNGNIFQGVEQEETTPQPKNTDVEALSTIVTDASPSRETYPPLEVDKDEEIFQHSPYEAIPEVGEDDDMTMTGLEGGYQSSRQYGYRNYSVRSSSDSRSVYPMTTHHSIRSSDIDTISSTRSIFDGEIEYHLENDRRYSPNYYMPNDEDEQIRMQIIHQVFLHIFDDKLTSINFESPSRILDIGTGTGEWAIGIGEQYPTADVTGIDLSPIQPSAVPSNVFFEIFDAEDEKGWTYPVDAFDLIHFRNMTGSFEDWDLIFRRCYTHLKPGGWIEIVDCDDQPGLKSNFEDDSEVHQWFAAIVNAAQRTGKDWSPAHLQPERLEALGFVDVEVDDLLIPLGMWPSEPRIRSMAKLWLVTVLAGLEALSLRPLTQQLGWDPSDVRRMCDLIGEKLKEVAMDPERSQDFSISVKVVRGRKPECNEAGDIQETLHP